jgi:formylmethanofuran dehydrogenase subunit E
MASKEMYALAIEMALTEVRRVSTDVELLREHRRSYAVRTDACEENFLNRNCVSLADHSVCSALATTMHHGAVF